MEEDDPVVEEIPVFLSQALAGNLFVLQYPTRPGARDWKDAKVVNAAIKPKNKLMRVEVGLDTESERYCGSKGEQIAINTDGFQESTLLNSKDKDRDKQPYFRNMVMDKIVYESSLTCTDTDNYAVAILQDKELHLTPIQGILQLRPTCSYFDKQDKKKNEKNSKNDLSDDEEKESEAQQVTVKFARQETDLAKKAREQSYKAISQKISDEPWYDTLWRDVDSDHAELERLKLFSATSADGSSLTLGAKEYIRALVPPPPPDEAGQLPAKRPPPADQLKQILLNAKLMTFNDLKSLIRSEEGGVVCEAALLSALSAAACCVRGLWAPRSADLYTRHAPVPARLLCAARDHVLYLFTQNTYVDRRKVAATVRLPPFEVEEIIKSVAKFSSRVNGWELLIPPDVSFETKYPEIIQRQNLYWEARQRTFNEMLIGESIPKRQRKKSQRDSIGSDSMMSPKPRCNSVSEEDSDVKKRAKGKGVGKRTRNMSTSSGAADAT